MEGWGGRFGDALARAIRHTLESHSMQLNHNQKRLIQRVVNVFETGSPNGDYASISIYKDGPHDIRQITYGRSQTTEFGNLRQLVEQYVAASGLFSHQLQHYAGRVGSVPLTEISVRFP